MLRVRVEPVLGVQRRQFVRVFEVFDGGAWVCVESEAVFNPNPSEVDRPGRVTAGNQTFSARTFLNAERGPV